MKKILLYVITLFAILLLFSCGECDHDWRSATCQSPQACSICGETIGDKLPHSFRTASENGLSLKLQAVTKRALKPVPVPAER